MQRKEKTIDVRAAQLLLSSSAKITRVITEARRSAQSQYQVWWRCRTLRCGRELMVQKEVGGKQTCTRAAHGQQDRVNSALPAVRDTDPARDLATVNTIRPIYRPMYRRGSCSRARAWEVGWMAAVENGELRFAYGRHGTLVSQRAVDDWARKTTPFPFRQMCDVHWALKSWGCGLDRG
jgi:hypothetical protein